MKYSLDLDAPLGAEVRRIAAGRLRDAADTLETQPAGIDKAIHDARRHIKQCRALYRLVASRAKEFQHRENERLGDIGRRLSALRDATALMEATHYLKREVPSKSNAMLMDRLARHLERWRETRTGSPDAIGETLAAVRSDLLEAAEASGALTLPKGTGKRDACLARGWQKTGRKARAAIEAASTDTAEAFHDLRKRTQDRWMQAGLLQDLWPTAMLSIRYQAKGLSDLLGHAQDLAVLFEAVSTTADLVGDSVEREAVRDAIATRQAELRDRCRSLADVLFSETGRRDRDAIELLLKRR